jgi:hypothetical protein
MRYFVLVCLLLSFAGCFGPFGAINVGGPRLFADTARA